MHNVKKAVTKQEMERQQKATLQQVYQRIQRMETEVSEIGKSLPFIITTIISFTYFLY